MRNILEKTIQGGLLKVLEIRDGKVVELTKKDKIEQVCHNENC